MERGHRCQLAFEATEAVAESRKVKSPLAPVRAWLKYLKIFGGFPLEIEDEEVTHFQLSLRGMATQGSKDIFSTLIFQQVKNTHYYL